MPITSQMATAVSTPKLFPLGKCVTDTYLPYKSGWPKLAPRNHKQTASDLGEFACCEQKSRREDLLPLCFPAPTALRPELALHVNRTKFIQSNHISFNGQVSRDPETGDAYFSAVSKTRLQGITKTWHPTQIDHLELRQERKLCSNVYGFTCHGFNSTVIARFARFEWEVTQLEAEKTAYEWIEDQKIGPYFLAHLTEEGRVIGFLMARIADCRHATPDDLPLCHSVLSRLHDLGIKHGDIN